jgi:transposase
MTSLSGIPLAVVLSPANHHDLRHFLELVFLRFPRVGGRRGRPRDRPLSVTTDKGYDSQAARDLLMWVGITPQIPSRGTPTPAGLGRVRWPVERTISWLKQFRRLRIRWDRTADVTQAFITIACSLIAWRYLNN